MMSSVEALSAHKACWRVGLNPRPRNGGLRGRRSRERPSAESSKTGLRNILDPLPHVKVEGLGRLVTALYTCTNALDQETALSTVVSATVSSLTLV